MPTINGTPGDDELLGTALNDDIHGFAGNDGLFGFEGNDLLDGGDDHDFMRGQSGNDWLLGGTGDDYLDGGEGDDILDGGDGSGSRQLLGQRDRRRPRRSQHRRRAAGDWSGQRHPDRHRACHGHEIQRRSDRRWRRQLVVGRLRCQRRHRQRHHPGRRRQRPGRGRRRQPLARGRLGQSFAIPLGKHRGHLRRGRHCLSRPAGYRSGHRAGPDVLHRLRENLSGSNYDDVLSGDDGENVFAGDFGDDRLVGGRGDDTLLGDGRIIVDDHHTGGSGPITTYDDAFADPAFDIPGNDTWTAPAATMSSTAAAAMTS